MTTFIPVQTTEQIAEVVRLAREIWTEHYVPIVGAPHVDYMLEKMQSTDAIREQIGERGYEYYLAVYNGPNEGYVAVVEESDRDGLMLSKIYVRRSERRQGVGKAMLAFVEEICRQRGLRSICLSVNKNNRDSIHWYMRMGFVNTGATFKEIGDGFVMDDYRMEKMVEEGAGI
jgi:ribosomal protein S18 acetylase RimI-like enzyme